MAQSAIMPCNDEESAGGDDTPAFLWRTETHDFFSHLFTTARKVLGPVPVLAADYGLSGAES